MDANSATSARSRSRRFKDQRREIAREDSLEAPVGSDTSSVSDNVELQVELTSMTGKVQLVYLLIFSYLPRFRKIVKYEMYVLKIHYF